LTAHNVFPAFLPYLHAFGTKTTDIDQHFGGASYRLHFPTEEAGNIGYELCYNFKFIVQTKPPTENSRPSDNWRIRQTGVYQQHRPNSTTSAQDTWILVQLATRVQDRLSQTSTSSSNTSPLAPHLLFLSAATAGWRDYFNVMEAYFLKTTESAVHKQMSMPGPTGAANATLDGRRRILHGKDPAYSFEVSFHDVQMLQQLEEEVQTFAAALGINRDILITLQTLNSTLAVTDTSPATVMFAAALEQYITDLGRHTRNVDALLRKIRGRSRLLYNVLDYQNSVALSTQGELRTQFEALQGLERHKTNLWSKKSVRDAAGIKIMTIMALLYLPASFIAVSVVAVMVLLARC
jgi:hypothetical protein